MSRAVVLEGKATRAEMIALLADHIAKVTTPARGETTEDVRAFARITAEHLVDEAIAAASGQTISATIAARAGN